MEIIDVGLYGIVEKVRRAHLSTSHHIKPEPSGNVRRGLDLVTSAGISPSRRTQRCRYVFSCTNIYPKRQKKNNLSSEEYEVRNALMHKSRSERQQYECSQAKDRAPTYHTFVFCFK